MAKKEIEIYTRIEQKDWGRADPARERVRDTEFLGSERNHYTTVTCGSWEVIRTRFILLYKGYLFV
jgi:hypothetical protein